MSARKVIQAGKAKAEDSLEALQKTIERDYGLPKGSVRILLPSGRKAGANATVETLKDRWKTPK